MKSIFDNIFNNYEDLDTNDPNEITKFQEYAIKKGLMNSSDITGAGKGKFGPKTRSAYNQLYGNKSSSSFTYSDYEAYKPSSVVNRIIVNSPGLTAITEGIRGLYHKGLNKLVDPEKHETLNKTLSLPNTHRNNASLNPIQNEIYQSIGNYAITQGKSNIDTPLINKWYKEIGQHNKAWNTFLSEEDKKNWKYANNKIDLLKKQFNPIERVMNTVGRASIKKEGDDYYITDVYDHNKNTYISSEYANNKNVTNPIYGNIVLGLQNVHLTNEDPNWQKQSTTIKINR